MHMRIWEERGTGPERVTSMNKKIAMRVGLVEIFYFVKFPSHRAFFVHRSYSFRSCAPTFFQIFQFLRDAKFEMGVGLVAIFLFLKTLNLLQIENCDKCL